MSILNDDAQFADEMRRIYEISKQDPDDPKDMFQYKYVARKQWENLLAEAKALYRQSNSPEQETAIVAKLAQLFLALGSCMIDCKETQEGKCLLDIARKMLESSRRRRKFDFADPANNKGDGDDFEVSYDDPSYDNVHYYCLVLNTIAKQWTAWGEELKGKKIIDMNLQIYDDWAKHSPIMQLDQLGEVRPKNEDSHAMLLAEFEARSVLHSRRLDEEKENQQKDLQEKLAQKRAARSKAGDNRTPRSEAIEESSSSKRSCSIERLSAAHRALDKEAAEVSALKGQLRELEGREFTELEKEVAQNMKTQHVVALYVYAQILTYLGKAHEAAKYFQTVLKKSLAHKTKEFDRSEWASNCLSLANYYLLEYDLPAAHHCISAAELVLPKIIETSDDEKKANHTRTCQMLKLLMARYLQRRLKISVDAITDFRKPQDRRDKDLLFGETPRLVKRKIKDEVPKVRFDKLPIEGPSNYETIISTLEEATEVYQKAANLFRETEDFFNMNDYTEEKIQIHQEMSSLEECMAFYGEDYATKRACHQRRISILSEPLEILTNVMFTNNLRQFRYELSTVKAALVDLAMLERKANIHNEYTNPEMINKEIDEWKGYLKEFVDSFHKEFEWQNKQRAEEERKKEMILDDDYCTAYLLGHMNMAQAETKYVCSKEEMDDHIDKAIEHYTHVVDYAKKCKMESKDDIKEQINLSNQMLKLLPCVKTTATPELKKQLEDLTSKVQEVTTSSVTKAPAKTAVPKKPVAKSSTPSYSVKPVLAKPSAPAKTIQAKVIPVKKP